MRLEEPKELDLANIKPFSVDIKKDGLDKANEFLNSLPRENIKNEGHEEAVPVEIDKGKAVDKVLQNPKKIENSINSNNKENEDNEENLKVNYHRDFRNIEIIDHKNRVIGEFDGINMENGVFIEDKSALRLPLPSSNTNVL